MAIDPIEKPPPSNAFADERADSEGLGEAGEGVVGETRQDVIDMMRLGKKQEFKVCQCRDEWQEDNADL